MEAPFKERSTPPYYCSAHFSSSATLSALTRKGCSSVEFFASFASTLQEDRGDLDEEGIGNLLTIANLLLDDELFGWLRLDNLCDLNLLLLLEACLLLRLDLLFSELPLARLVTELVTA